MKITVDAKLFVNAANWAGKNFDGKEKSCILMEVQEDGVVTLSHSNEGSYMSWEFNAEEYDLNGKYSVSVPLDGRFLKNLSKAIPSSGQIVLEGKGKEVQVSTKQGTFTIPTVPTFSKVVPDLVEMGTVDSAEFFEALQRIAKLCDSDRTKISFLNCVDVSLTEDGEGLRMFGLDRFVLGETSTSFTPAPDVEFEPILVPQSSATSIPPSSGISYPVTLLAEHNDKGKRYRFGYGFPDGRIALFNTMDIARFENFDAMKKKGSTGLDGELVIAKGEMEAAVKTISSLDWDSIYVFMDITADEVIIHDESGKNSVALVPEEITGLDKTVYARFSRESLLKGLAPVPTKDLRMKFGGEKTSTVNFGQVADEEEGIRDMFVMVIREIA